MENSQPSENNQPIEPTFTGLQVDLPSVPRLENLSGLFRTQSSVPTQPARKLDEQIRIVGGVPYIYDTESDAWIPLGGSTSYPGRVASGGTASTPFPVGWSVSRSSAGVYVVTHNLGNTNYAVQVQVLSSLAITLANVNSIGSTSFEVRLYNHVTGDTWTATDTDFSFILAQE